MGSIINLAAFKKRPKIKLGASTVEDEFEIEKESLFSEWKLHEATGTLNVFVSEKLGENQAWMTDRYAIAEYESFYQFVLMSPGYTLDNLKGWQAAFVIDDEDYETPVLETELEARVFCVLLYFALVNAASKVNGHKT